MSALAFLIPRVTLRRARNPGSDGLFILRQTMVSFSVALVVFGVVLPFTDRHGDSALPWVAILAVMAVASIVLTRLVEKPLDCTSPTTLGGSYRTRFFVRVAFAESVALFGFVFAFAGGPVWIYYVGAAFALVRFWTAIAPTRVALADDQRLLDARGCGLSLIATLRGAPPATT
jgi:F0F1-type ATP synthase membrane subunit c/vacuolar-type H+-ATPase subunit K